MSHELDNTILDIDALSSSVMWELYTDYSFKGVIEIEKTFTKELSELIRAIIVDEITNKGTAYLRSNFPVEDTFDRIYTFCENSGFDDKQSRIFSHVLTSNHFYELTIDSILSSIPDGHWEIWIIDKISGVYILRFINDIRIEEWERANQSKPENKIIPF